MDIETLEQRLLKGENYLSTSPNDQDSWKLYYRLTGEYVALKEQQEREANIASVTIDLPPGTHWQRDAGSPLCARVRVLYHGEPAQPNEMTRGTLAALLRTRAETITAMRS